MKKRNIAFSGVMAAILFSAGAANAATARIASQQYVDNKEHQFWKQSVIHMKPKKMFKI